MDDALMDAKVLRRAAEIVEMGWLRGGFAVDESGRACPCESPRAARWCILGARIRAMHELDIPFTTEGYGKEALQAVVAERGGLSAMIWNDSLARTAEEVAAALRAAADRCERRRSEAVAAEAR